MMSDDLCSSVSSLSPCNTKTIISSSCFQNVKILTYREPQNPEYRDFVSDLKTDAKTMFNYTIEDTLVRSATNECNVLLKEPNVIQVNQRKSAY